MSRSILDAARTCFGRDGYAGATVARIACEAGVSNGLQFCRTNPLLPALLSSDPSLQLQRMSVAAEGRLDAHRELIASILERGIERGEFQADLDVPSVADPICQLMSDYSRRAYLPDPDFPATPRIVDAAVRLILDALRARQAAPPSSAGSR